MIINPNDNVEIREDGHKYALRDIAEGENVVVSVRDNGIGIPEADQPRIFERFYRVDKARSRAYGGTGLGLSIAQEIVNLHGGTIALESAPGKGTCITVTLPIDASAGRNGGAE